VKETVTKLLNKSESKFSPNKLLGTLPPTILKSKWIKDARPHFRISYGGGSWACAEIRAQQAGEKTFRNTLEHIEKQIMQPQTPNLSANEHRRGKFAPKPRR
jgi:hypothetical protein